MVAVVRETFTLVFMRNKDLLIIARPDHSYNIYKNLLDSELDFTYMVFKLFPSWLNRFFSAKKLRPLFRNYSICWSMTIVNALHYNLRWNFLAKIHESNFYTPHIARYLKRYKPALIHYWPEYCCDYMRKYKVAHPEVKTMAEIVFLNEQYVLDEVGPCLESMGLGSNLDYIKKNSEIIKKVMEYETDFIVPSELAADTFRKYYPDKNYHVQTYGIPQSECYKKKHKITDADAVKSFVYAGTVSVEKGCDLICQWFSEHCDKEIHLYGHLHQKEHHIFEKYKTFSNIHFHGAVPKADLQDKLKMYDAGLHISRFDSYSLAVAEIIGCGLPVIVSNMTGICTDVQNNNLGIVTEVSQTSLDNAIKEFCNPGNYNQFIESIDDYFKKEHSSYGVRSLEIYSALLKQ